MRKLSITLQLKYFKFQFSRGGDGGYGERGEERVGVNVSSPTPPLYQYLTKDMGFALDCMDAKSGL